MGGGLGRVTKHPDYYLNDGSVSFLTAHTLFRVHRSFFERESEVFRELFASAAEDDPKAGTDASPFTLDVQPDEFKQFLWVWYDRDYSYHQQTKDNWLIILRLATRWKFAQIRQLAVRELEALELPPAERISIYSQFGIDGEELLSSYVEVCKSPVVPTVADSRLIPMDVLINLLQAREDAQRKAGELGLESPTSASLEDEVLREIISERFNKGLNPRSNGTSTGSGDQASDLNGERARATRSSTITLEEPQIPNRATQSANRPPPHPNSYPQTGGEEKGVRKKEHEHEVKGKNVREKAKEETNDEGRLATASQDKEKQEKARQAKEKEDREKAEKSKLNMEGALKKQTEEQKSSQGFFGMF